MREDKTMNMQNIIKGLVCFCLLVGGLQGISAQSFQSNQTGALYTISSHGYREPSVLSGGVPSATISSHAAASSYSTGVSQNYSMGAWKGSLSEVGAVTPINSATPPAIRRVGVGPDGGGDNTSDGAGQSKPDLPLGDTPYWLFAVLLAGYCVWRKKRANV